MNVDYDGSGEEYIPSLQIVYLLTSYTGASESSDASGAKREFKDWQDAVVWQDATDLADQLNVLNVKSVPWLQFLLAIMRDVPRE